MTQYSEIKERLLMLISALSMSLREFSIKIGKDPSYIKGIKKEISSDVLRNIYNDFPSVNLIWIITGEGDMMLSTSNNQAFDSDASTLLRMFNDKDKACAQLQKEKEILVEQKHQLEKEVQSLKIALGIEEIPKSKVG